MHKLEHDGKVSIKIDLSKHGTFLKLLIVSNFIEIQKFTRKQNRKIIKNSLKTKGKKQKEKAE